MYMQVADSFDWMGSHTLCFLNGLCARLHGHRKPMPGGHSKCRYLSELSACFSMQLCCTNLLCRHLLFWLLQVGLNLTTVLCLSVNLSLSLSLSPPPPPLSLSPDEIKLINKSAHFCCTGSDQIATPVELSGMQSNEGMDVKKVTFVSCAINSAKKCEHFQNEDSDRINFSILDGHCAE